MPVKLPVRIQISDMPGMTPVDLPFIPGGGGPGPGPFGPLSLFANGEEGAWYDPSDTTTLFKDAAGNDPVTADGDPVGLMLDLSPNGNDASQSVTGEKPIYRTDGTLHWLEFDGAGKHMVVPVAAQGAAADSNTLFTAALHDGVSGFYLFGNSSDNGVMALHHATGWRGTAHASGGLRIAGSSNGLFSSGETVVGSTAFDRTAGTVDALLSNGYSAETTFTPGDKIVPANSAIGIRGTQVASEFGGKFFGLILINRTSPQVERTSVMNYLASKSGVTL